MLKKEKNTILETELSGYPIYPPSEDLFNNNITDKNVDPEDVSHLKAPNESGKTGKNNDKGFTDDKSGSDLDIPGSESDISQENIGSEDEENNYDSLGGGDHNDLDEDTGE